jgi:hypothetical protein
MKFIHLSCLQTWLKSKLTVKSQSNEFCTSYSLRQVECELCKQILPDFVKYKGKLYELWDFIKPTYKSYMTIETILTEKNCNRTLYVMNMEGKSSIRIGRGHESDIRITDISVSRYHSSIRKTKDGSFLLEDNNSKFGTLVLVQHQKLPILFDQPLNLQLGRTCLTLSLQKPFSLFSCICFSKKVEKETDYQILNAKAINFENYNTIKELNDNSMELETDNFKETENNNVDEDKQLEEANTQAKIDFNVIKDQLQKDLDSLRAVFK